MTGSMTAMFVIGRHWRARVVDRCRWALGSQEPAGEDGIGRGATGTKFVVAASGEVVEYEGKVGYEAAFAGGLDGFEIRWIE